MNILLNKIGSAIPKRMVTNEDISKLVDTSDEWIVSRTGIKSRYILEAEEELSTLAIEASKTALAKSDILAEDIDLIIVATSTSDKSFPSCACEIQAGIGAISAACFDVSAACSGFIYALHIANALMKQEDYKNALVVGADALSRLVDWKDRGTCILFGDGVGAAVLSKDTPLNTDTQGILGSIIKSDGRQGHNLYSLRTGEDKYIHMSGQEVFKFAVKTVPESIEEVLGKLDIAKEEIKFYILHQANERIIESVSKRLGEDISKFPKNIDRYGNTSSASIPVLLNELMDKGSLNKGDLIVLSGFGAGLTWGSMVIKL